jgi:hypothetical protein
MARRSTFVSTNALLAIVVEILPARKESFVQGYTYLDSPQEPHSVSRSQGRVLSAFEEVLQQILLLWLRQLIDQFDQGWIVDAQVNHVNLPYFPSLPSNPLKRLTVSLLLTAMWMARGAPTSTQVRFARVMAV